MKKLIVFVSLIIFIGTTLNAQESWQFGIKGGVNFTKMNSEEFAGNSNRVGFHVGLLTEIPLGNKFSIQPEVLYSTQGTKADVIMFGGNPTVSFHLDYIQVPLVIKWYLTQSLALEAGPSFNFLVNNELGSQRVQPLDRLLLFGIESDFGRKFEFGGVLGASYKFGHNLLGSARYVYGLTDAFDSDFNDKAIHNYGFQLGFGILF
ncbi:MAG: porin family protein [Gillisia sp.]